MWRADKDGGTMNPIREALKQAEHLATAKHIETSGEEKEYYAAILRGITIALVECDRQVKREEGSILEPYTEGEILR